VVAGLRRALRGDLISAERAAQALHQYLLMPLARHGHQGLLARMLELGSNFSPYDACYVALAERVRGELLTADERLSRAVRKHTRISVVP
jgi:predicted nucleic acid-binding protein